MASRSAASLNSHITKKGKNSAFVGTGGRKSAVLTRAIGDLLDVALRTMRVVVVTGPRQAGKSTLVKNHPSLAGRPYFTLDDTQTLMRIKDDPHAFLRSAPNMIIDEVQRDPSLILAIKSVVDAQPKRKQALYVLTGSANLLMMKHVGDSLSGRAYYLRLQPLTRREQLGLGTTGIWTQFFKHPVKRWLEIVNSQDVPKEDWRKAAQRGGFPAVAVGRRSAQARSIWFDGYIATYLERDLRDLQAVTNLRDFQTLMKASSLRIGGLLNHAELARDVRLPSSTVHQYMNLLETSFQATQLPPYARNRTLRLIKTPKLYWNDVGLALHLSGAEVGGAHLENLILTDLLAWRDTETPRPEISYWRTANGAEVDFVAEWRGKLLAVEVKASAAPTPRDAAHLKTFCSEYGSDVRGCLIVHGGDDTYWLGEKILAVPWWRVI